MTIWLLLRSFARWFRSELTAVRVAIQEFDHRCTEIIDDYVSQRVLHVTFIEALTPDERERITPQVEAHVTITATKKATPQAIRDIISERRVFLWTIFVPLLGLAFIPPAYDFLNSPNGATLAFRGALLIAVMVLIRKTHKALAMRSNYAIFVVAFGLTLCSYAINGAHSAWPTEIEAAIQLPVTTGWQQWDSNVARIDEMQSISRVVSLLKPAVGMAVFYGLGRFGLAAFTTSIIVADGDEYQSVVVDELLRINQLCRLVETTGRRQSGTIEPRDLYVAAHFKNEITYRLQSLARIFEGPWRRSMHIGDKVTDSKMDIMADGMAAAARNWMLHVRTQGISASSDAREAFSSALVNATDGNWRAMAMEGATPRTRLRKKLIRALRTITAIAIIITMIAFLKGSIPGTPTALQEGGLQFPIALLATLLAAAVDPHASERISTATRIIEETSQQKKKE
ncbi:hypothetical protein ACIHCX_10765 [Streptomyces sp. NPDC052043]|uniref:hypothetical protein n=1 Tax=Streptomyces sp. NPDC052043 TaxID=3365684 RepID=UPI0037CE6B98